MKKKLTIISLILILLLGGLLRIYRMEILGTFRGDQAIELSGARQILSGKFTLIGIKTSTSEVRNGAVMYYLLSPVLYLFNFDPVAGGVLQSFLSLATVVVVFLVFHQFKRDWEGLISAFLVASSPLLVQYSRQTLLAYYPLFFNALALYIFCLLTKKYSGLKTGILGFVIGFTMQVHYSTIGLVVTAVVFPLIFLEKKYWVKYLFSLIIGAVIGFLPMIAFEVRHEFFNTKMAIQMFSQSSNFSLDRLGGLASFWLETISGLLFRKILPITFAWLAILLAWLVGFRKKLNKLQGIALLMLAASLMLTILFSKDIREPYAYISHYGIEAFVPIIILTAMMVARLPRRVLAVLLAAFLIINIPAYSFNDNHGFSMKEGWNLKKIKSASQLIEGDYRGESYNVAMLVDAENQAKPLRYFLDFTGVAPLPVENYSGAKYLYVVMEPGLDLDKVHLWEIDSFGSKKVEKSWDLGDGFSLFRLDKSI